MRCDGAAVGRLCMDLQDDAGESQPEAVEVVSVATSVATAESEESDEPRAGHADDPDGDVTQTTKFAARPLRDRHAGRDRRGTA